LNNARFLDSKVIIVWVVSAIVVIISDWVGTNNLWSKYNPVSCLINFIVAYTNVVLNNTNFWLILQMFG